MFARVAILQNGGNSYGVIRSSYFTSGPGGVTTLYFYQGIKWFRIYDDGTLLYYSISSNGADWIQIYSETLSSTSMGTITLAGVAGESYGSRSLSIAINSFEAVAGTGTNSSWQ